MHREWARIAGASRALRQDGCRAERTTYVRTGVLRDQDTAGAIHWQMRIPAAESSVKCGAVRALLRKGRADFPL